MEDKREGLVFGAGCAGTDLVDDVAGGLVGDLTEDRVLALEPRGGRGRDEELRAVGALAHALAGVGHGEDVGLGEVLVGADLVVERVARSAEALTDRAAALDHEVRDDAVEDQAVVERGRVGAPGVVLVLLLALGETDEVLHRLRGLVLEEVDDDVTVVRVQGCLHGPNPRTTEHVCRPAGYARADAERRGWTHSWPRRRIIPTAVGDV